VKNKLAQTGVDAPLQIPLVLAADLAPSLAPLPTEIREQLERILASSEFSVPDRGKKFLSYLVEETLAGRAERIKAYTVAIEVFSRNGSFDAQNDPVVRIEAGRIRRALERYYLVAGQADPILIGIPKGAYVPHFERRKPVDDAAPMERVEASPAPEPPKPEVRRAVWYVAALCVMALLAAGAVAVQIWSRSPQQPFVYNEYAPKVIVRPFDNLGGDETSSTYSRGLTAEIVGQLAKFKDIIVITGDAEQVDGQRSSTETERRFELSGWVRTSGNNLRFIVNLLDRANGQVLWTRAYESEINVGNLVDFQKGVAAQVATELGQAYGVIIRAHSQMLDQYPPEDVEAYACTLSFFDYRQYLDPKMHAIVRDCLQRSVARYPEFAAAWALLALVLLDEERFGYNHFPDDQAVLERALVAARTAISIDPNNVRAQQALMGIYFFMGNVDMSLSIGRNALTLNPNDMELTGEFGVRLAVSGSWQEGANLIERALVNNPSNTNYYLTVQAFAAYMLRDYEHAADLVRRVRNVGNPLLHLIAAAIHAERGDMPAARAAADRYEALGSGFLERIDREMEKRNLREPDKAHFVDGLRKAGLPVKSAYLSSGAPH